MEGRTSGTFTDSDLESPPRNDVDTKKVSNYLPWLMRPWCLCIFLIILPAMICITEYLLHTSLQHTGLFEEDSGLAKMFFRNLVTQFFGLPTLALIRVFFYELDQTVKRMEPFYQLSNPEGASGWNSLCVDYIRPSLYLTPILAIRHQHWAVLFSSLAAIISTDVLTILAFCVFSGLNDQTSVNLVYARAFEGFLGLLCFLAATLAVLILLRNSGLEEDPGSLEALMNLTSRRDSNNSLYTLFRELKINDETSENGLNSVIGPLRFQLQRRDFDSHLLNIVQYTGNVSPPWYRRAWNGFKAWVERIRACLYHDNHPTIFQTIPLLCITAILLALFAIANGQPFWSTGSTGFSTFLMQPLPRSAMSALTNSVIWAQIDKNTKLMEPIYLLLNKDGAYLSVLRFEYGTWPLQDLYYFCVNSKKMSKNRAPDYVTFLVMLGTYASNIFSFSWNTLNMSTCCFGPTYWASLGIMVICEPIMLAAIVAIFMYRRRPVLPRQPVTLASNLLLVYATNLPIRGDLTELNSASDTSLDLTNDSTPSASIRDGTPRESQDIDSRSDAGQHSAGEIAGCISALSSTSSLHENFEFSEEYERPIAPPGYIDTETEGSCAPRLNDPEESSDVEIQKHSRDSDLISIPVSFSQSSLSSSLAQVQSVETFFPSHPEDTPSPSFDTERQTEYHESSLRCGPIRTYTANQDSEIKCALGRFKGSDGRSHLGIGKYDSVEPYRLGEPAEHV